MRLNTVIYTIIILFSLQPHTSYANDDNYYGYYGACNDAVYVFDFHNESYKIFGVHRITFNGTPKNQYFKTQKKLKQSSNQKYIMSLNENEPSATIKRNGNGHISANSPDYGNFSFELCDPKSAKAFIQKVIDNIK